MSTRGCRMRKMKVVDRRCRRASNRHACFTKIRNAGTSEKCRRVTSVGARNEYVEGDADKRGYKNIATVTRMF